MFSLADFMTMSAKKDAIVSMGASSPCVTRICSVNASVFNIHFEGYITYGGLSGSDMNALAQGLYEGTEFDYLETRIKQVEYLGKTADGLWNTHSATHWRTCGVCRCYEIPQ